MKTFAPVLLLLAACALTSAQVPAQSPNAPVLPGIETFLADVPQALKGKRVGLITNHTGIDRSATSDNDLIAKHPRRSG